MRACLCCAMCVSLRGSVVRACVSAWVRACVRACMRACVRTQQFHMSVDLSPVFRASAAGSTRANAGGSTLMHFATVDVDYIRRILTDCFRQTHAVSIIQISYGLNVLYRKLTVLIRPCLAPCLHEWLRYRLKTFGKCIFRAVAVA